MADVEFQRNVAVHRSEREKASRDSGEGDEKFRWVIMAGGPKWWWG